MSKKDIQEIKDSFQMFRKSIQMVREQNEDSSATTEDTSSQSKVTFTKQDSLVQNFITDINNIIQGEVHIKFQELDYYKSDDKVQWSGTITDKQVAWTVIYSPSDSGVYFDMANVSLEIKDTQAIHKLNIYLRKTWFSSIAQAQTNNELTK